MYTIHFCSLIHAELCKWRITHWWAKEDPHRHTGSFCWWASKKAKTRDRWSRGTVHDTASFEAAVLKFLVSFDPSLLFPVSVKAHRAVGIQLKISIVVLSRWTISSIQLSNKIIYFDIFVVVVVVFVSKLSCIIGKAWPHPLYTFNIFFFSHITKFCAVFEISLMNLILLFFLLHACRITSRTLSWEEGSRKARPCNSDLVRNTNNLGRLGVVTSRLTVHWVCQYSGRQIWNSNSQPFWGDSCSIRLNTAGCLQLLVPPAHGF